MDAPPVVPCASHAPFCYCRAHRKAKSESGGSGALDETAEPERRIARRRNSGNQILKWTHIRYDPAKRLQQSDHSIENTWRCFDERFQHAEDAEAAKKQFAGYLVLDAVVGNTDRYRENWGIVRERG